MHRSDPPLPLPSRLGRYELRSVLGRGGGGVVYEATLVGLGGFRKRVALKVLGVRDWRDADARAALQREARIGALLSHPNVVAILDLGQDQGRWYLAMELVDGHPVSALWKAGLVDPAALVEIGVATCAGLAHIHDLRVEGEPGGLVHRDIKPQNLLVDRNGSVKVADFGITVLSAAATDRAGTPTWMAPEQHEGRASAATDLFSLGAVLYALAARRPPFGVGAAAIAAAPRVELQLADPAFLAPVDAALPGLGAIVRRCLRLDPSDRYPSAPALAADLRALRARTGWSDLGARVARVGGVGSDPRPSGPPTPLAGEPARARDEALFGRDDELTRLAATLAGGARRLALTGPGGIGKTRLARALAERITDATVVWVELRDDDAVDGIVGLAQALGHALGVSLVQGDPVRQAIAAVVARGRPVLFFDGVDAARTDLVPLLDALLAAAPAARAVLTARTAPNAREEQVVPVAPLRTPDGVALFEHRLAAPLAPAERAALPALVEGLDGIPLALELAAARARVLGVRPLLERLSERFRWLVDPARPAGSLRATLAASFALLRPFEARALAELSVFPGSFTLDAAEAVIRVDAWPEAPWPLDLLAALLDASLLRVDRSSGRFTLLHSVRAYAAETLDPTGRRAAEVRHGEHFAQLGSPEVDEALRRRRPDFVRKVETELDNLRIACERAVGRGDGRVAEQTALAATAIFLHRGPFAVGAALVDRVLALPDLRLRGNLLLQRWAFLRGLGRGAEGAGTLAEAEQLGRAAGDAGVALAARALRTTNADAATAVEILSAVRDEAQQRGEPDAEVRARSMLGYRLLDRGDLRGARGALESAWSLALRVGDARGAALATMRLGGVDLAEGLFEDALRRLEEAERLSLEIGDDTTAATTRENRAAVLVESGQLVVAVALFEEALSTFRGAGNRWGEANTLLNLGTTALRAGRTGDARVRLDEAASIARAGSWSVIVGRAEGRLGQLEAQIGRREDARARFGAAAATLRAAGLARDAATADALRWLLDVEDGRADPGEAAARFDGIDPNERVPCWTDLGHLSLDRDDAAGADRALAAARAAGADRTTLGSEEGGRHVLDARLAVRAGELPRAARLLAAADPALREDRHRVRLHQARAEVWLAARDPEKAAAAVGDLFAAADRAGFGAQHPIRTVAARLAARTRT